MIVMDTPLLQDLVDAPMERLDVEYKAWLNLDDKESQATLAKHLCALANHGGGYVVFGIEDDMTPVEQPPREAGPYDSSVDDRRVFSKTVPVAGLARSWPELTAAMLSRVLRVFDAKESVSARDIQTWSEKFRR